MVKLIASDIDGTLLKNGAQKLNPELFDMILKLKEQGVRFIAASGRQYASIRSLFEPVKDDISYIAENGSLCIHNGEILNRGTIDRELGLRIIREIRKRSHCELLLSCEDTCYIESKNSEFIHALSELMGFQLTQVEDLTQVQETFLKLAIYDSVTTGDSLLYFQEKFGSEIKIVTSGNVWLDFISPEANKGTALEFFCNYFSIDPKDSMAFGDQYNDIEMLAFAGQGYAMSTAAPGVASHSRYVTDSVEEVLKDVLSQW